MSARPPRPTAAVTLVTAVVVVLVALVVALLPDAPRSASTADPPDPGAVAGAATAVDVALQPVEAPPVEAPPVEVPPVATAPAGRLPPRPAEISTHPGPPIGELAFTHGLAWLEVPPDADGQPRLALVNGADGRLEVEIDAVPVTADALGAPVAHDPGGDDDAAGALPRADGWITLAEERLALDPGEQAVMRPTATVPPDADPDTYLAAVRARGAGAEVTTLIVVDVTTAHDPADAGDLDLAVEVEQRGATATIELRLRAAQRVTAVAGELTVHGWWGGEVVRAEVAPVVVLPGTEQVRELDVRPPPLPGRYTATVALEDRTGGAFGASASGWLWDRAVAIGVAAVLLVIAGVLLLRARRSPAGPSVTSDGPA